MIESEKKKLTLSVDSEIVEKAKKDPDINISDITEKYLKAFTSSSETIHKEELYKNYQELFKLMSRLLRKFRVKTEIGYEEVVQEVEDPDDEELVPEYDDEGNIVGYEGPMTADSMYYYLESDGSFSQDRYDFKNIKEIPIEAFHRPQRMVDNFLSSIQKGVEYRKEQFKEIEMAKTIIDAITKGTISGQLSKKEPRKIFDKRSRKRK